MSNDKPDTKVVSAGRMSEEHFGAVNTPVYRASTILYPDLASMAPGKQLYTYGRRGTPGSKSLEDAITELEGGADCGVDAFGPQRRDDRDPVGRGRWRSSAGGRQLSMSPTRHFCDTTLKRLGIETSYYPPSADIAPLLKSNTRAVFCESPGSLTFEIQDIPAIARAAHAKGASVLMDNTWATPLLFDAHGHGVDLSIQAATKYLGGHADVNDRHRERQRKPCRPTERDPWQYGSGRQRR